MDKLQYKDKNIYTGVKTMRNNFSEILGRQRKTISEISRNTGISRSALTKIYYEQSTSISFSTLKKLCDELNITPNDLLIKK